MKKYALIIIALVFLLLLTGCRKSAADPTDTTGATDGTETTGATGGTETTAATSPSDPTTDMPSEPISVSYRSRRFSARYSTDENNRFWFTMVRSVDELDEALKNEYPLIYEDYLSHMSIYDDAFFEDHTLVFIHHETPSYMWSYTVTGVSKNAAGDLFVEIDCVIPELYNDASGAKTIIIEVEGTVPDGAVCDVQITERNIDGSLDEIPTGYDPVTFQSSSLTSNSFTGEKDYWFSMVRSVDELQAALQAGYPDSYEDHMEQMRAYDQTFFQGHTLVLVHFDETSSSVVHTVTGVSKNAAGDLLVAIDRVIPESGEDAPSACTVLAEVEGTVPDGAVCDVQITDCYFDGLTESELSDLLPVTHRYFNDSAYWVTESDVFTFTVVNSVDELNHVMESAPYYGKIRLSDMSRYDEAFFEGNTLVLVLGEANSAPHAYRLTGVSKNEAGDILLEIDHNLPYAQPLDLLPYYFTVEIEGTVPDDAGCAVRLTTRYLEEKLD